MGSITLQLKQTLTNLKPDAVTLRERKKNKGDYYTKKKNDQTSLKINLFEWIINKLSILYRLYINCYFNIANCLPVKQISTRKCASCTTLIIPQPRVSV